MDRNGFISSGVRSTATPVNLIGSNWLLYASGRRICRTVDRLPSIPTTVVPATEALSSNNSRTRRGSDISIPTTRLPQCTWSSIPCIRARRIFSLLTRHRLLGGILNLGSPVSRLMKRKFPLSFLAISGSTWTLSTRASTSLGSICSRYPRPQCRVMAQP